MEPEETISAFLPMLRHRVLRVLLISAPGLTSAVAIFSAQESNLALAIALNVAAGVVISSILFLAVSTVARGEANERVLLAHTTEQGTWRARIQHVSRENEVTGLYKDWYFRLRLLEELERSQRYELSCSVLLIRPMALHRESELWLTSAALIGQLRTQLRRFDLPAFLEDGQMAVLMPNTGRRAAKTARQRIAKALELVEPAFGLACFPGDGEDPQELLKTAADDQLEQSAA